MRRKVLGELLQRQDAVGGELRLQADTAGMLKARPARADDLASLPALFCVSKVRAVAGRCVPSASELTDFSTCRPSASSISDVLGFAIPE
jgi:hypothetical protein